MWATLHVLGNTTEHIWAIASICLHQYPTNYLWYESGREVIPFDMNTKRTSTDWLKVIRTTRQLECSKVLVERVSFLVQSRTPNFQVITALANLIYISTSIVHLHI